MSLQSRWQKLKLTTSNAGSVDLSNLCSNHKKRPTKRTPDAGDSAAISSSFLRLSLFPPQRHALRTHTVRKQKQGNKHYDLFPCLLVYLFTYPYNFSNSSSILLKTSKPPCQNFAERMSTPASARICAGASEPPADNILRYFGLKDSPSALYC